MKAGKILILLLMLILTSGCVFEEKVYISFETDGGSSINKMEVVTNMEFPETTKQGFTFEGWYYDEDLSKPFDKSKTITENTTLYAKWEVAFFQVVFKGVDDEVIETQVVEFGKTAVSPTPPVHEGKVFIRWDQDFSNITSDLVVKAIYEAELYKISFNPNGGSQVNDITDLKQGDAVNLPVTSRVGYLFKGWFYDDALNQPFDNNKVITSDITLYAKWDVVTFQVVFKDSDVVIDTQIVEYGKSAIAPANPIHIGQVFVRWDQDITNITSDMVIKAIYEAELYTISFNSNGGSQVNDITGLKHGDTINLPISTRVGNLFKGWFYDDKLNQPFDQNKKITNDFTLYAKWEVATFQVVFKDAYDRTIKNQIVEYGKAAVAPTPPVYEGQLFVRWDQDITNITNDIVIKAIYEIQYYKVSFNTAGGSQVNDINGIKYKDTVSLPASIRDGYVFKGWRYGGQVFTQEMLITGNVLLEAVWETTGTFTITFDSAGGLLVGEMTVMVNDGVTLPTLSRDGYKFMGWKLGNTILETTFIYTYEDSIHLTASWTLLYEPLVVDGNNVVYRNKSTQVMIPTSYTPKAQEFRGAWVTAFTGDVAKFVTKEQYKAELTSVLDLLESYNMNAIIFHLRATNDALYDSDLNPKSSLIPGANFAEWDYLEWFIDECHRRNIEFHAWLNPYRIKAYGYSSSTTPAMVASGFNSNNAASNPDNILMTYRSDGTQGAILNPGRKEVRDFVVATCMEIIERYDIDAIHFDDYFYAQMSPGVTILTEPDQGLYEQYIVQNPGKYSQYSSYDKANWRREQINIFIEQLSNSIRNYNYANGRSVELGISPTGVYRNGNGIVTYDSTGTAITTGSNTAGQEHYASYLFCDSKRWIDEEWINYIVPQTYWGFTHTTAGYADVVDWWAQVVKNKNVKLYTGMGLYMADEPISKNVYSWRTNAYESSNQVLYNNKHELIKGTVIFSYKYLKNSTALGLKVIKEQYWNAKVPTA